MHTDYTVDTHLQYHIFQCWVNFTREATCIFLTQMYEYGDEERAHFEGY